MNLFTILQLQNKSKPIAKRGDFTECSELSDPVFPIPHALSFLP